MRNGRIRLISFLTAAAMLLPCLSGMTVFAGGAVSMAVQSGGTLLDMDFEQDELGAYPYVSEDDGGAIAFEVVDGAQAGREGHILQMTKKAAGNGNKIIFSQDQSTSSWGWNQDGGERVIVTSFSASSGKTADDSSKEALEFAVAGGNSAADICGGFKFNKGGLQVHQGEGSLKTDNLPEKINYSAGEWYDVAIVNRTNTEGEVVSAQYYINGQRQDVTASPTGEKAKKPDRLRMVFDKDTVGATYYIDNIKTVDFKAELAALDQTAETDLAVSSPIISSQETIELPLEYNGAKVVWTSSHSEIINPETMTVTHPDIETEVTLTAVLEYWGVPGYSCEDYKMVSQISHPFTVTVEAGGEMTDEKRAKRAAANLELTETELTQDTVFPEKVEYQDDTGVKYAGVTWSAQSPYLTIEDGSHAALTRPSYYEKDAVVKLTAAVTVGEATENKEFSVKVLKNDRLVTDGEKARYAQEQLDAIGFSEEVVKVLSGNVYLPAEIFFQNEAVASITWQSEDPSWLSDSGIIQQRPGSGSQRVFLNAEVTAGSVVNAYRFEVSIKAQTAVKAFPGAQGYGTQTRGGAEGYVVHVTTLAASGPGSLKEAMEDKKGARTIVFDVGGTIDLTPVGRALRLSGEKDYNVTIAGQTAPGNGIQLKGYGITLTNVHDVIVRNISIRIGNIKKAGDTYQSDPLSVSGANQRVVIDHCSMSWGIDMGFRVYGKEITMSNCMISKGLYWNTPHEKGKHNYAGIFGAEYSTFYNNYIADCGQRAPRICDNEYIDVRNNVVFNSKYTFDICNYEWMGANTKYNIVNNMVLKGNPAPGGSTSNTTTGGSFKYFQGRTYSGGLLTYSINNYDDTKQARPLSSAGQDVSGGLWTGSLDGEEKAQIQKELYGFSKGGYSNITSQWHNMIFPSDISMEEYDKTDVSHKGNTLVNYPFPVPDTYTRTTKEATKYVLENAGANAPVRGILDNRYLAEGRTRLSVKSDYSKASGKYGIKLDQNYDGDTAYGLPVQIHSVYTDENGATVYDVDANIDTQGLTLKEQYKFVSCDVDTDTLYVMDTKGRKYRLELDSYEEQDDIYDAFAIIDVNNQELEKPSPYVSDNDSSKSDGMHFSNDIIMVYADWGDGPGNYDHKGSGGDEFVDGTTIDMEWSEEDWPQLPTVYRDADFDTNRDGIPDFYVKLKGWDKMPGYSSSLDISRLYYDNDGYTNLEHYINDYCAGDVEIEDSTEFDPVEAENIRDGSSKYNTHTNHEILFNTVRRAKAKVYYCEGENFDMDQAIEISLNTNYNHDDTAAYLDVKDFKTYFSAIFSGLKSDTVYSYRIKTYSDVGIEAVSDVFTFKTKSSSAGKPQPPRILKYVPFDGCVTLTFEPGAPEKTYGQETFSYNSQERRLTSVSSSQYDSKTDHYILRYSKNADLSNAAEKILKTSESTCKIEGLENGVRYYFDLRAVSADGTESDTALYNDKKAEIVEGEYDKDGNPIYKVQGMQIKNGKIQEFFYDSAFKTIAVEPTQYVVNEDYQKNLKEAGIGEGETSKFITYYGDVKDWYIYTLGGIPIPASKDGSDPMLMLRDDSHDHGFTYAKKFSTPLAGQSTIRAKIMICDEELDPMNQNPELRFYLQQDSADSEDTDVEVESDSTKEATTFGNIITLQFAKNELIYNGSESIFRYEDGVWYDIKLLMDGNKKTCALYINDALIRKDMPYIDTITSTAVARWQISSRLAGTEDVYIDYMYAYSGIDEVKEEPVVTAPSRPGAGSGSVKPAETPAPTQTPEATPKPEDEPNTHQTPFVDLDGFDWAREAVASLNSRSIIYGVDDTHFAPEKNVTRAEFITLLMRGFELIGKDASCSFTDVADGAWYYPAVAMASSMGIVSGYADGRFGPDDPVTREDMAVMIVRLAQCVGLKLPDEREEKEFADGAQISGYAADAVKTLYKAAIINGVSDTEFAPKDTANRAMAAKMIYETLKLYE